MAERAIDLAFALFDQGKRPRGPEVKALGLKGKSIYNYFWELKPVILPLERLALRP